MGIFFPHFEFWADFPPSFEFWHQNPLGKHQNSLKRGYEKFSTPQNIFEHFPLRKIVPPPLATCLSTYVLDWCTGGLTSTKRIPKSTGGLVTSTFFELDWGLVLVPFKMYWCTRWSYYYLLKYVRPSKV